MDPPVTHGAGAQQQLAVPHFGHGGEYVLTVSGDGITCTRTGCVTRRGSVCADQGAGNGGGLLQERRLPSDVRLRQETRDHVVRKIALYSALREASIIDFNLLVVTATFQF